MLQNCAVVIVAAVRFPEFGKEIKVAEEPLPPVGAETLATPPFITTPKAPEADCVLVADGVGEDAGDPPPQADKPISDVIRSVGTNHNTPPNFRYSIMDDSSRKVVSYN